MGAAMEAAKACSDPASASAWLAHASGAAVIVAPDTQAELIGKALGGGTNEWIVRSVEGATLTVAAGAIRRVPATRGSQVRVVVGESRGFVGAVLSADSGVGVLRSVGEARKVRVLPLDALCVLVQEERNQLEPGAVEIS